MPSYLDLGLIGVILISALLAMLRGFTREVLAIVSWGAAAIAALYLYPFVLNFIREHHYIDKDSVALAAAIGSVFFITLVVVSLITVRLSDAILDSRVGALDRSIGFVFGALRGLLLCGVAFIFFNWLVPEKTQPEWVKAARMRPLLVTTGDEIMSVLPDDPDSILAKFKRPKTTTEEPAADTDTTPSPPPRPAGNGRKT